MQAWPGDALEAVARKALRQADLGEAERETLVGLCQDIHCEATTQHCLHSCHMGCDALHFKRACCSLDFVLKPP